MGINARWIQESFLRPAGDDVKAGCLDAYKFISAGLANGDLKVGVDIDFPTVAEAFGVVDRFDVEGSINKIRKAFGRRGVEGLAGEELIQESGSASVVSTSFQAATGDMLAAVVNDAYSTDGGFVGNELCTIEKVTQRNQNIATMQGLGDLFEVPENHPYEDTGIGERWVRTKEKKYGRMISFSMETLLFDRTGNIRKQAAGLGVRAREKWEQIVLAGVQDILTDSLGAADYVWRPLGVPTALYVPARKNAIGEAGAPTGYTTALPLQSWQDLDTILRFRATEVKDDRVDGTPQPIAGLNSPSNVLLIPWALKNAAFYATQYSGQIKGADSDANRYNIPVNGAVVSQVGKVIWSRHLDANSANTYYYGPFKDQFTWTELLPVATFTQGPDSDSAFERDRDLAVKVRFMGGLTAVQDLLVTRIKGA